jgi:hypothetical protein
MGMMNSVSQKSKVKGQIVTTFAFCLLPFDPRLLLPGGQIGGVT